MDNRTVLPRVLAGLFFIIGIGLIVTCVFLIGLDRGLTQPKFETIVLFNEVGGLVQGAPIRLSGVNVGIVGPVDFLTDPIEGRSLKVELQIFKKYEWQFRKCSRVSIKTEGVLGQKLVEVSQDADKPVFDTTKPIIGEDPLDVEDMAGVITRTALGLQNTTENLDDVLVEWKYISHKTRRLINRVEEKITEGSLFKLF